MDMAGHTRETADAALADTIIEECGLESFPASDPPSWWTSEPIAPRVPAPNSPPGD